FHPTVSKGHAVKQLANKLSIHKEDIVCIGDGGNDLSMITYAGCGVAMANADPAVKEAADFHTLSNNDNGVAYALEKQILNEYICRLAVGFQENALRPLTNLHNFA